MIAAKSAIFLLKASAKGGWDDLCPDFQSVYSDCKRLGGRQLHDVLDSVTIDRTDKGSFVFTTKLLPGLSIDIDTIRTEYIPDKVIRLGQDYHVLVNGTYMSNLPSHETSYCQDGKLFRSETTFLPDNSISQELITIELDNEKGNLLLEMVVNGELELHTSCSVSSINNNSNVSSPEEEETHSSAEEADSSDDNLCPVFNYSYYNACESDMDDGMLPVHFFDSFTVEKTKENGYLFTTELLPGLPMDRLRKEFHPDKVIRLGADIHVRDFRDLSSVELRPSHETSYCKGRRLIQSETTFLPDNTIGRELITIETSELGELLVQRFENGNLKMKSFCMPGNNDNGNNHNEPDVAPPANTTELWPAIPLPPPQTNNNLALMLEEDSSCPKFEPLYNSCKQVDGGPPFFHSGMPFFEYMEAVEDKEEGSFLLTATLERDLPNNKFQKVLHPDRVIRLGLDNHVSSTGEVLRDLVSHETSYCQQGKIYNSETTFLPDNSINQELITLETNPDDGELFMDLVVNGRPMMKIACSTSDAQNTPDSSSGSSSNDQKKKNKSFMAPVGLTSILLVLICLAPLLVLIVFNLGKLGSNCCAAWCGGRYSRTAPVSDDNFQV